MSLRRTRHRTNRKDENISRPKVERMTDEEAASMGSPVDQPSVVLVVPSLSAEVRRSGDDLVLYLSGEERARIDIGPIAKDVKILAVDVLLKFVKKNWGPLASQLVERFLAEKKST